MALLRGSGFRWLVAGLGNPGGEYERTRHNAGFRTLELLAEAAGVKVDRARFRSLTAAAEFPCGKVLLMKPLTFMNASGMAVQAAAAYYKIPPERILIISDDVNLPVGRIRIRPSGSAGGHNGLKSIISALGTDQFPRIRVGVGAKPDPESDLADWVLGRFSAQEEKLLSAAMTHAAEAAETVLAEGVPSAAARFNGLQ